MRITAAVPRPAPSANWESRKEGGYLLLGQPPPCSKHAFSRVFLLTAQDHSGDKEFKQMFGSELVCKECPRRLALHFPFSPPLLSPLFLTDFDGESFILDSLPLTMSRSTSPRHSRLSDKGLCSLRRCSAIRIPRLPPKETCLPLPGLLGVWDLRSRCSCFYAHTITVLHLSPLILIFISFLLSFFFPCWGILWVIEGHFGFSQRKEWRCRCSGVDPQGTATPWDKNLLVLSLPPPPTLSSLPGRWKWFYGRARVIYCIHQNPSEELQLAVTMANRNWEKLRAVLKETLDRIRY